MSDARRYNLRDLLLTTTALVAALAGGSKGAAAGSSPATSGLSGFNVVSGGATLSTPSPTKSVITQSTGKAIITWSAFSIPKGSTVQFVQPGRSSIALNRVTGGSVSNILGDLIANGQIWLINPAGVFIGRGANVDVAGLIATTSDIQNGDFLSGNYQFGIGSSNPNASIVNQGTIRTAQGGSAVLAGAQVTNQGLIQAQLGSVVLAGAKTFAVDFQGDKLLSFQVTGAVDQTPQGAGALVSNEGTIQASGGTVLLTARAAKNIIDNVINSSGIVEATAAQSVGGEIVLDGGGTGQVTVSGTLDASGKGAGETGGTVKVLGDQVTLAAGASIDVSGNAGGGTALVGGNFHGAGPEQNASTTTISAGATINASAIGKGNGGKVAVWSDTHTTFGGTITATGGSLGGNGGYIETSGQSLTIGSTAKVNTSAAKGTAGSWLLDPADFTVDSSGSGDITPGQVTNALATGNVLIETDQNLVLAPASDIIYSSANALALLARQNVTLQSNISNGSTGAINIVAGWDGVTGVSGTSSGFNRPGVVHKAQVFANPAAFGQGGGSITMSGVISTAGGAINLAAFNVTAAGQISSDGAAGNTNVNGGAITIMAWGVANLAGGLSSNGAIQTSAGQIAGSGGAVFVQANGITLSDRARALGGTANVSGDGGSGGSITLDAMGGALTGVRVNSFGGYALAGNGGAGGAINLNGASITTTGQVSSKGGAVTGVAGGRGGDSGTIQITSVGDVTIGQSGGASVLGGAGYSAGTGGGGTGAAITITSSTGSIALAAGISDFGGNAIGPGNGGNASPIVLSAAGNITLGPNPTEPTILTRGGNANVGGSGGNGSSVSITAGGSVAIGVWPGTYNSILTRGGYGAGIGSGGNGGAVSISGAYIAIAGPIVSRGAQATRGNGGNGGAVSLYSSGNINLGYAAVGNQTIRSEGGNSGVSGNGGNGGAVSITAAGYVTIGVASGNYLSILSRGGDAAAGNAGYGAAISITGASVATAAGLSSRGGDALLGTLGATSGGLGGNAGAISITATAGNLSIGTTNGSTLSNSQGNLVNSFSIVARGGDTDGTAGGGSGASVVLSAPSGSIAVGTNVSAGTTVGSSVTTRGGDDLSTSGGTGGSACGITVNAGGTVTLGTLNADEAAGVNSMVVARGGNAAAGQGGNAGNVSVAGGEIDLAGIEAHGGASTTGGTGGSGGAVTLVPNGPAGAVLLAYTPASGAGPGINTGGGFAGATQNGAVGSIEIDGNIAGTPAATLANS